MRRLALPHVAVALFAAGCLSKPKPASVAHPPPPAVAVSATGTPSAGALLAAHIDIVARHASRVSVQYGPTDKYGKETHELPVPTSGSVSTTLIGLEPDAVTHFRVVATGANGTTASTPDSTVATKPLEAGVPRSFPVALDRSNSGGFVLFAMNSKVFDFGLGAIVDRTGRLVWCRPDTHGQFDFEPLANGHFIHHRLENGTFEEIDLDGTVLHEWRDTTAQFGMDGHDFAMLPNGHALMFVLEPHAVDTRRVFPGGVEHSKRTDDEISEVRPDGAVAWRWSTFSYVSEAEITDDPGDPLDPKDYQVTHLNTIEPLPDDALMLSLRNMSSLVKVDRKTGAILWRLGGKRSDFRFVGDPLGGFFRQHDARRLPNGNILLFDNGNLHDPPESRAVEYRLDERAKTAELVWQYRRSPPVFARIGGSSRRLPNGNTIISYGPKGLVVEVDASSNPVWEIYTPLFGVYRATAAETLVR